MSPEILTSRISDLNKLLQDLEANLLLSIDEQKFKHYELERQVQLAVDLSLGVARRLLSLEGAEVPAQAKQVFFGLAQISVVSKELAEKLALATGLRNILVHEYRDLDEDIFFTGLPDGAAIFKDFARAINDYLVKKFGVT